MKNEGTTSLPVQYLDDRSNFAKVNQLLNDAMDLTKPPDNSGQSFSMLENQKSQILTKLKEGINLSKKIDDDFLDYLDPKLKDIYRNKYIKGNELFLEGLEEDTSTVQSRGVQKQLQGNNFIGEWSEWWYINKDRIIKKAFQE